ncbi:MAG: hypothetical protein NC355_07970 [Blautia sp.]|nr:hypothetical protein [Blautia sp.]
MAVEKYFLRIKKTDQLFLCARYGREVALWGLTGYQLAPLVYLVLAVVCVVSGRRLWCRMQIGG